MIWSCQSKIPSNAVNQFIRRFILRVQRIKGSGCSFCGGAIKSHPNTIAFCYTAQKSHKWNTFQRDWINRLRIKTYFYIYSIYYICYLFETAEGGWRSVLLLLMCVENIANNSNWIETLRSMYGGKLLLFSLNALLVSTIDEVISLPPSVFIIGSMKSGLKWNFNFLHLSTY